MKTIISDIPVIQKSKISIGKTEQASTTSCCTPKNTEAVCCTPGGTLEENKGACCAQPEDGTVCCNK